MKKKNGLVWYIVAGVFAVSGLYALVSGTSGGIVTLIVAAALAFVGYKKSSSAKKAAQAEAEKAAAMAEGQRPRTRIYRKGTCSTINALVPPMQPKIEHDIFSRAVYSVSSFSTTTNSGKQKKSPTRPDIRACGASCITT